MSFSVAGKSVIVTGASSGVGLAVARHMVDAGARVMLADMSEEGLEDEVQQLSETGEAAWFAGDLRERLTLANLMSATIDAYDRLDILVNGHRQVTACDPLNIGEDLVEDLFQQNVMPSLRLSQMAAKRMMAQAEEALDENAPAGSIINLSSIAARRTQPSLMAFSVAAAALDQMTRSMAVSLAEHRIRVNAVAFGSVMSQSLKKTLRENREYRQEIVENTPLSRIAGPREIAETVQFLASESAAFVTGQILTVDGGRTLIDPVTAPAH
ncbi:MAG: SDR family NAD(P)-dependent oxidoreductase [Mangrovicoccus sp.]